jgi:hypothetical protein
MGSDEDAQAAIKKLNNYAMGGRNLTVNEARPKTSGGGSGFGGDRGGYGGDRGGRSRREPRW